MLEFCMKSYFSPGNTTCPVADCNTIEYSSHKKTEMKLNEYIDYLQHHSDQQCLYLKDWHFVR